MLSYLVITGFNGSNDPYMHPLGLLYCSDNGVFAICDISESNQNLSDRACTKLTPLRILFYVSQEVHQTSFLFAFALVRCFQFGVIRIEMFEQ